MVETHAHTLVHRLLQLMPSPHLRASLQCLLALFLASPRPRATQAKTKSEASLSRFLNRYGWPTRKAIQTTRQRIRRVIDRYQTAHRGRLPIVYAVVDLTGLEKTGKYQDLALALLRQIPQAWRACFKIRVLADAGFSTTELIPGAQTLGVEVIMSARCNRRLADDTSVQALTQRGQTVTLKDLSIPVTVSA